MSVETELVTRSGSACELCTSTENLHVYAVPPNNDGTADQSVMCCATCHNQLENPDAVDANHWRCLNDSMWSEVPAVKVVAWRMLDQLRGEGWPQDLLDMIYLDEETLAWAKSTTGGNAAGGTGQHVDCNGAVLEFGDTVVMTQTVSVKGSSLVAKRGTPVRNIRLVNDEFDQIEGKVEGQNIVILTKFVRKK